jgi:hypothetical protein
MKTNEAMQPATKADVEEVAAGLNKEFVRLENKVDALDSKVDKLEGNMKAGFETVLEELRGMRNEMKIGRQAGRIESAELSQRMDTLEQEVKRVKEKVGLK